MEELVQNGLIEILKGNVNAEYMLKDNNLFLPTGYKVLRNQEKSGFIKCSKVLYNGNIKLIYFSSKYKSFRNMVATLDGDSFLKIVANLLNVVMQIQSNGFLACQNLDLSFEKIFIEPTTLAVHVIYLPVNTTMVEKESFDNDLRTRLIKLITSTPTLMNDKVNRICGALSNGSIKLDELYKLVCNECKGMTSLGKTANEGKSANAESDTNISSDNNIYTTPAVAHGTKQYELVLSALKSPMPVRFVVNTPEFLLGKNPAMVDGAISFNNAISKVHCKIVHDNGNYYVQDMGSANGTYVNKNKIPPNQLFPIKNGDVIRLANSDFMVQI